ncbi:MAG: Bro-N domain-containing protein [Porphyromonadaceae bacterium]|nr:Bro-N domain-containing protein [Porphyromonadaceae bacterium]
MSNSKEKTTQAVAMTKVFTFNPSNQPIQVEIINQEPWFVAKDICDCLGLQNVTDRIRSLDDDERLTYVVDRAGQNREVNLVSESGLYNLIFQSRKPEAKKFRKWVTSEVLPSIRKSGSYSLPSSVGRHRRTRGELVNADILHLLWLIGESLNYGDQKEIALELGVSVQSVSRTLNGYNRSNRILMALYKRARQNREAYMLYNQPSVMADRLLNGTPIPEGNHLPAVKYDGRRGGQIGNQNARKNKGGAL